MTRTRGHDPVTRRPWRRVTWAGAAGAVCVVAVPSAVSITYRSLDQRVMWDAQASSVSLTVPGGVYPPAGAPPAPFVSDGQKIAVTCRDGAAEQSTVVDGAVVETTRVFALTATSPPRTARDFPLCVVSRQWLMHDQKGPFNQENEETVPLLPVRRPRPHITQRWAGTAAEALVAVKDSTAIIDARKATNNAAWLEEGLGGGGFVVVCDLGSTRVVGIVASGPQRLLRHVRLGEVAQPAGVRRSRCRLGPLPTLAVGLPGISATAAMAQPHS